MRVRLEKDVEEFSGLGCSCFVKLQVARQALPC